MAQFFISYSRVNLQAVERLRQDLQNADLNIWIDQVGLQPGTPDWDEALRNAIQQCDAVILVASPESRRSPYVRDEIALAQDAKKPIYPVWVAGDSWINSIPMGLGSTQNVDLREENYDENIVALIAALRGQSSSIKPVETQTMQRIAIVENPRNPYKGLRAFREEDSGDFFGRDTLIEDLIAFVEDDKRSSRLLAVLGASGSGKSSVMMAGVLPKLRQKYPDWIFLDPMIPGTNPLEKLTMILARQLPQKSHTAIREDLLDRSTRGLHRLAGEISDHPVVLYVDQFEEIFTLVDKESDRRHFIDLISTAATDLDGVLYVLLSMRADFYDRPLQYQNFGKLIETQHVAVTPMTLADLYDVVQQPARLPDVGLRFDEGLVTEMVFAVREEIGALPLLQFTLDQLFEQRQNSTLTIDAYQAIGGVQGALARHAENTYNELPSEQHRQLARALFMRLIEAGQTELDTTRRRARYSEITLPDVQQTRILQSVADAFVDARLLVTDQSGDDRTVEVSHEALIREWQRLGEWLRDAREDLRLQKTISADVADWLRREKPDDMLYRGVVLEMARTWLERNHASRDETAFINAGNEAELALKELQARQEKSRKNLQRLIAGMTVGLLIAIALSVFAFIQQQAAKRAEALAVVERERAENAQVRAEREGIENNSISLSNLARFHGRTGENPLLGLAYAIEANTIDNPPFEVQRTLAELAWQPGAQRQLIGHGGEIWGVAYSPDGRYVYTGAGSFTGEPDNSLIQWDVATGEIVRILDGHDDRIYSVDISPDGRFIATGSQDTNVIIWDAETGAIIHVLQGHLSVIFDVLFTNDSTRLISGGSDSIMVWDVASGERINSFDIHGDIILDMDITTDDRLVFSGGFDGSIALWELDTGIIITIMNAGAITGARFLPDETRAVTSDQNGSLLIWNLETGDLERSIQHVEAPLRGGLVVSPDGDTVIAADDNGNLIVWDITSPIDQPVSIFRGHGNRITSLAMSPDGSHVTTVSFDYTAIIWDILGRDAEISRFTDHNDSVYAAVISPDGSQITSASADGHLIIQDKASGEILHDIQVDGGTIYSLAYHPDGNTLLSASEDSIVRLWDVSTGELLGEFSDLEAPVRTVTFNPDGTLIAAAGGHVQISDTRSPDNRILVWNLDGETVHTFEGHQAAVRALIFTPDGTGLLSGSDDTQIILWTLESGEQRSYDGHFDAVWTLAFNRDGSEFLSGSRDRRIIHWNTETGEQINTLNGHRSGVRAVVFHPNGIHAISAAGDIATTGGENDYELLYYDLISGEILREMPGHTRTIRSLSINEDGTEMLSSADDSTVILWHVDTLDSLLTRLGENYEIICIPQASNSICTEQQAIASNSETVETSSPLTGFPTQIPQDDLMRYADDSLCLLPDEGSSPPDEVVDTSIFAGDAPYTIGYSNGGLPGASADWIAAWAQYEADQSDLIENFIVMNAGGNSSQQIADIETLINDENIDALIVNPVESSAFSMTSLQIRLEEIVQSGIPVVLVGNRTSEVSYTSYVGHDPYEVGCIMAQELSSLVDGEGSIGFINAVDLSVADLGFKEGSRVILDQFAGIERTAEGATSYQRSSARSLTSSSDIIGILGYSGEITLGAQDGVASRGLDYVPFVSDHTIELALFAQENDVDGVFVRGSTQMGATAVQTALAILQGEEVTQFERVVPGLIYTSDLDSYDLENAPETAYLGDWEDLPERYYP